MNDIADPPTEEPTQALQRSECQMVVDTSPREITPQQARNESIATMLDAAYQRASTLQLTKEEAEALAADFPDEAFELGAGGDKSLLYLSHVYIRQRLNQVLGVGAAVPVRRREWSEEFTYFKDRQEKHAARVYVEMVLIVRGCVVGEAIADAIYYKDNAKDSYADTLEKAKSNAFRRCAKEFGVGLQPWMKGFCEAWRQRNHGGYQNAPRQQPTPRPFQPRPFNQNPPQPNVERTAASPASVLPAKATPKTQEWAWNTLVAEFGPDVTWDFLVGKQWVDAASNDYSTWNLDHVPTSKPALAVLADEIRKSQAPPPGGPSEQSGSDLPPEWADVIFSIAPKGMKKQEWLDKKVTLGQMYRGSTEDKKRLFTFAKSDWRAEDWIDGQGRKRPPSQEDVDCRIALDVMMDWRNQRGESSGD